MKGATNHLTPGEKVAYFRRRRGISQAVLAGLVGKTVSWVEKIESGRASLQMLPNIALLADVLDIPPMELLPDDIVQVDPATRGRSVPALRRQLLSYRFVNPYYLDQQAAPIDVRALETSVGAVWSAYQLNRPPRGHREWVKTRCSGRVHRRWRRPLPPGARCEGRPGQTPF